MAEYENRTLMIRWASESRMIIVSPKGQHGKKPAFAEPLARLFMRLETGSDDWRLDLSKSVESDVFEMVHAEIETWSTPTPDVVRHLVVTPFYETAEVDANLIRTRTVFVETSTCFFGVEDASGRIRASLGALTKYGQLKEGTLWDDERLRVGLEWAQMPNRPATTRHHFERLVGCGARWMTDALWQIFVSV